MHIKLVSLLLIVLFSCTACQSTEKITYIIDQADSETIRNFSGFWTHKESQWIEANKYRYFTFACAKDYIPIEYLKASGPSGIGVSLLMQVSKATGLKFKIYENNLNEEWHTLIESFKSKKIDILPTVSYSEERTLFMDFSKPYIRTSLIIIGHKDLNDSLHITLQHAKNNTAVPKGYWLNEYLVQKAGENVNVYSVNSTKEAFDAVSRKKASYTISELAVFSYYRKLPAYKHLRTAGIIDEKNPIMLGLQKDLPELKSIINKVIVNIDKTQLLETSLVMPSEPKNITLFQLLIILLSILIIVTGYLLLKSLQKLITTKKLLENNIRQKEKFMADISHDLKTPLMIIMGYIDTITDGEIHDKNKIQDYLKRTQSITLYIQNLVNDLFFLSKLENSFIKLHKESTNINNLIQDIASIIQIKADKKNISVSLDLVSTTNTQLDIDAFRIRQVLNNLLHNAIKFNPEGGSITVSTEITSNGKIQISIKDSGFGISKEDLPFVFDRYYKSENNTDSQSSGLGLCIARQLVTQHGGKIWVESEHGKGSTFFIEL